MESIENNLIILIISVIISALLIISSSRHKKHKEKLGNLSSKYNVFHDEYCAVYNNMPIAALICTKGGIIKEYNAEAQKFIEKICKAKITNFNIFENNLFVTDHDLTLLKKQQKIEKKMAIRQSGAKQGGKLYIHLSINAIALNNDTAYLILIIDDTQAATQQKEIDHTNEIYTKAFTEAKIGICRLNLFDNKGFATNTWFDNLHCKDSTAIPESFKNILPQDYQYIEDYIHQVQNIQFDQEQYLAFAENNYRQHLNCNIRVQGKEGKEHHLLVIAEIALYNPDNGEIIAEFLNMNIDDQKEREAALEATYLKTKAAEELKTSFIIHMSNAISTPLNAITLSCQQLLNNADAKANQYLYEKIEINTNKLLTIVTNVVDAAKERYGSTNEIPTDKVQQTQFINSAVPAKEGNLQQKTLLVAEDNENNYKLLSYMIKNKYKIVHAWNGEEAVMMHRTLQPDLILMDIKMPIMDGYTATAKIREIESSTPIIAITAYTFDNEKDKILNSGFNNYLSKPVNEAELFKILDKYL